MSRVLILVGALLLGAVGCANAPACEIPDWDVLRDRPLIVCDEGVPVCLLPDGEIVDAEYYPDGELASADRPFCLGVDGGPRCNALIYGDALVTPSPACVSPYP